MGETGSLYLLPNVATWEGLGDSTAGPPPSRGFLADSQLPSQAPSFLEGSIPCSPSLQRVSGLPGAEQNNP
jgi:hypothetical protein